MPQRFRGCDERDSQQRWTAPRARAPTVSTMTRNNRRVDPFAKKPKSRQKRPAQKRPARKRERGPIMADPTITARVDEPIRIAVAEALPGRAADG